MSAEQGRDLGAKQALYRKCVCVAAASVGAFLSSAEINACACV